ncbi:hypothetical protein A2U01_0041329, partial [Trifolium medium]|nr:hypothetical protein [Trifolium medium]
MEDFKLGEAINFDNDNSEIFEATWDTRKVVVERFLMEHENKVDVE